MTEERGTRMGQHGRNIWKWLLGSLVLMAVLPGLAGCAAKEGGDAGEKPVTVRIGSLKGPTSMGLVNLMADSDAGSSRNAYAFEMVTQADELVAMMVQEKLDIALVPANLAAVLYQRTEGAVSVIDVNTLGVLYLLSGQNGVQKFSDLKGKTIFLTGKGTTPDYALRFLLQQNGLTAEEDVTLEYKSEATEVAALLAEDETAIGLLPQPFATTALMENEKLRILFDLSAEWDSCADSSMVTGVTIVRNAFLDAYPDTVRVFLEEHQKSVEQGEAEPDTTCARVEQYGIIKEAVAKQAYPYCNIVCLTGQKMKTALEGYLEVLYGFDAATVGGKLPEDEFYKTGLGENEREKL